MSDDKQQDQNRFRLLDFTGRLIVEGTAEQIRQEAKKLSKGKFISFFTVHDRLGRSKSETMSLLGMRPGKNGGIDWDV